MKKFSTQIIFYSVLLLIWELIGYSKIVPVYILPTPSSVMHNLKNGFEVGTYHLGILISLRRIIIGYSLSLIFGALTGVILATFNKADTILSPLLLGIRSLPSICWLPIGIMWFGLDEKTIMFVIIMGASFSIALATRDGVRNISPIYLKAAATMGATGLRKYTSVIFPAALPSIVIGMKLGWAFAWRSLMAGEMLFVSLGLGHLLMMGRELNDINQIVAIMFLIIIIGNSVDIVIFGTIENKIKKRWGLNATIGQNI